MDAKHPHHATAVQAAIREVLNTRLQLISGIYLRTEGGFTTAESLSDEIARALPTPAPTAADGTRMFKVHTPPAGCPTEVPWSALNEGWAQKNHDQSLERLNQRGGLCPEEIFCNVKMRPWYVDNKIPTETESVALCMKLAYAPTAREAAADRLAEALDNAIALLNGELGSEWGENFQADYKNIMGGREAYRATKGE